MPNEFNYTLTVEIQGDDVHFEGDLKEILWDLLRRAGPMTRGELHKATGVAKTTLYDNLVKLLTAKRVTRANKDGAEVKPGRKFIEWKAEESK